jgi:hypothetical protein
MKSMKTDITLDPNNYIHLSLIVSGAKLQLSRDFPVVSPQWGGV